MATTQWFISMGEFFVTHTPYLRHGLDVQSYFGKDRTSNIQAQRVLRAFSTTPWNGWGHRVYAFVYACITRAWWDDEMPLSERGVISLLAFHTLRLGKMMAFELGREYLHHSSYNVLTRTAACIAIRFASWPSHWPRFRPKSSMEWSPMETSFAFKRQSHPTGNFDAKEDAIATAKHGAASLALLEKGAYKDHILTTGLETDLETEREDGRLGSMAMISACKLMVLCCPTKYSGSVNDLRAKYVKWAENDDIALMSSSLQMAGMPLTWRTMTMLRPTRTWSVCQQVTMRPPTWRIKQLLPTLRTR